MKADPIVENERFERLGKIRELAQRVHANRDRIERNGRTIEQAAKDNETAKIELESDRVVLCEQAVIVTCG